MNILQEIGEPACLEQLAEECTELAHAALKLSRILRAENPTPETEALARAKVFEEMADVIVCKGVLEHDGDQEAISKICAFKTRRWEQRLEARG